MARSDDARMGKGKPGSLLRGFASSRRGRLTLSISVHSAQTRAMALEVDALVRSIENEKLDQLDREQARDALARIDGIRDQVGRAEQCDAKSLVTDFS